MRRAAVTHWCSCHTRMTFKRRLSSLSVLLVLTIGTVGAAGIAVLLSLRPALARHNAVILGQYGVDEAIIALTGLTLLAVAIMLIKALRTRRAILQRVGDFRLPPVSPAGVNDAKGDELDGVAHEINALFETVNHLRARQRTDDEVGAAKRFTDNIIQSMFDVLIVTNPDLKIVTVNRAACALLMRRGYVERVGSRTITSQFRKDGRAACPGM